MLTDPRLSELENDLCEQATDWRDLVRRFAEAYGVAPRFAHQLATVAIFGGDEAPWPDLTVYPWAAKFDSTYTDTLPQ